MIFYVAMTHLRLPVKSAVEDTTKIAGTVSSSTVIQFCIYTICTTYVIEDISSIATFQVGCSFY